MHRVSAGILVGYGDRQRSVVFGDAVGVREMTLHNNHAENNAGIFLVFEFAVPVLMLGSVLYHRHLTREEQMR